MLILGSKFEQSKDKPALGKSNNGVKLKDDNSQLNYKVKDLESKHSKLAEDNVYLKNQVLAVCYWKLPLI